MSGPGVGRARQERIYREGLGGRTPTVPTDAEGLEIAARRRMSTRAWAYVAGGAGERETVRANRSAFDRYRIVPRMLAGVAERSLATTVLGTPMESPLLVAPIGAAALVRRDADLETAAGASAANVPYILSSQGCTPMERTAREMGSTPHWFQLYWSKDEVLVDSFLSRAEATGARAIVVTVDTTLLGWRTADLNLAHLPFSRGIGLAQYTSDPRFVELVRRRIDSPAPKAAVRRSAAAARTLFSIARNHPGRLLDNLRSPVPRASVETFLDTYSNPALSWDHLATLRSRTSLPIVVKGILHPDDAVRAFDTGADAVMVSNHGGRQVDRSIAAIDALVAVRRAVGADVPVLFDSGIRSGADVFVALALGADAVAIGRSHVYGLALAGRIGVTEVLENFAAELDLTMALTGVGSIADIRDVEIEQVR